MRNLSAFRQHTAAGLAALVIFYVGHVARADEKKECSDAYEQTQTLRHDNKLQSARQQAGICTRDACAEFIRTDCSKWLSEIDASQPTVVIVVQGLTGREIKAVRVALDGKAWLEKLDGSAKPVDPGLHTIHYEIDGAAPIDDSVEIHEGEKNRRLSVSFAKHGAPLAPTAPAAPAEHDSDSAKASSPSVAPWVIGGVGVASLLLGAITGGLVVHDKSVTNAHCNDAKRTCDASGDSASKQGRTLGPVTTVALVVGGVGVSVGTIWLIARSNGKKAPPPSAASVSTGLSVTTSGAGWQLEGNW